MKALRFDRTGSLDELRIVEADAPRPGPGDALVEVYAAAINPSDVKNVLGKMAQTIPPRIPGRDFAGVVRLGPKPLVGRKVFGTGGDLGFGRDGSHAQYVVVPAEAATPMPSVFDFDQAAAFGLGYLTAWQAIVANAQARAGETILILGASGAVGRAAAHISRAIGARVIGVVRTAPAAELPVDDLIDLAEESLPEAVMRRTAQRGADVALDVVGGALFEPCLRSLAQRGRHVAVGSAGDPRATFNLVDFYHREARIIGVDTLKLGFRESAEILRGLLPGIEQGLYPPPPFEVCRLPNAVEAYRRVAAGAAKKKLVIAFGPEARDSRRSAAASAAAARRR